MLRIVFVIMFVVMMILLAGCAIYLVTRFHRFAIVERFSKGNRTRSWLLAAIPLIPAGIAMFFAGTTVIVVLLHMVVFWLIADGLWLLIGRISKREPRQYYAGKAVLVLTVCYFAVGWYHAHHVVETRYEVATTKDLPSTQSGNFLRILQITDMHLGATFDGKELAEYLDEMQECEPDIIVITGDFVDEASTREDMMMGCQALGEMKSTYGTYFVYGNHDKGVYTSSRDFDAKELQQELAKNGITILEDDVLELDDELYLIGRKDKSESDRMSMSELVKGLDKSQYMLVLDHQPTDYEAQKESAVDLVLSGHTHGGHIYPAGLIGEALDINCMTYGIRQEGNTTFEVSSGISGWAIPFKTGGAISEYVILDIYEK